MGTDIVGDEMGTDIVGEKRIAIGRNINGGNKNGVFSRHRVA